MTCTLAYLVTTLALCAQTQVLPQWDDWPMGEEGVDYRYLENGGAKTFIYRDIQFDFFGLTNTLINGAYNFVSNGTSDTPFARNASLGKGAGLYFEHIFNGAFKDNWRARYTPETDYKHFVGPPHPSKATLLWPRSESVWNLKSRMTYNLRPNGIQVSFSVKMPATQEEVQDIAPLGWVGFMWASYTRSFLTDEPVEYLGVSPENGGFGWHTLVPTIAVPHWGRTEDLPAEPGAHTTNIYQHPDNRFLLPFYYRVVQPEENGQIMIYAMFFNKLKPIRIVAWDQGGGPLGPYALDWHYIVDNPLPNKTYRHKTFLLYEPTELTDRDEIRRYVFSKWLRWYRHNQ